MLRRFNKMMVQLHFAERRSSKLNTVLKVGVNTRRKVEIISVMEQLWCSVYKDK